MNDASLPEPEAQTSTKWYVVFCARPPSEAVGAPLVPIAATEFG